jgi:hypothetical protein
MKIRIASVLLLLCCVLTLGCKDPYGACVKAGADIGAGIGQGMHAVDQIRQQGLISSAEESNVIGYLEFANKGNEAFTSCASTAHTLGNRAGSFTACANAFSMSLNNPAELALIKISNPAASQQISTIINGVTTGVSAVVTALGGA